MRKAPFRNGRGLFILFRHRSPVQINSAKAINLVFIQTPISLVGIYQTHLELRNITQTGAIKTIEG
jgi:hypothetical protein